MRSTATLVAALIFWATSRPELGKIQAKELATERDPEAARRFLTN